MTISGVLPPIPTPFTSGTVDAKALRANAARWLATELAGLVVLGTNGEAALLSEEESDRVVATVREEVPRGRWLVAGTGRESTAATVAASRRAAGLGADALLVRTPATYRPQLTRRALVDHFRRVANESPAPVILYNFPQFTGVDLTPDVVGELAIHPNVVGIKESSGDVARVAALTAAAPDGFFVTVGNPPAFYPSLCVGAAGGILAVACVVPDLCVQLWRAVQQGRHADALAIQRQITPLALLVTTAHGVAGLKAALDLAGYVGGEPRPPLAAASREGVDEIRRQLTALSVLA